MTTSPLAATAASPADSTNARFPSGAGLVPARTQAESIALWPKLQAGVPITIVKLAPEGHEATRYPATVVSHDATTGWVLARAIWTHREVDVDGVVFRPDDPIDEYFSPHAWFNAFAVWHGADCGGWYCNVTYPTRLTHDAAGLILTWHDLYLDVIVRPDGSSALRDEDELAASGLAESAPALHQHIEAIALELHNRLKLGETLFTSFPADDRSGSAQS